MNSLRIQCDIPLVLRGGGLREILSKDMGRLTLASTVIVVQQYYTSKITFSTESDQGASAVSVTAVGRNGTGAASQASGGARPKSKFYRR